MFDFLTQKRNTVTVQAKNTCSCLTHRLFREHQRRKASGDGTWQDFLGERMFKPNGKGAWQPSGRKTWEAVHADSLAVKGTDARRRGLQGRSGVPGSGAALMRASLAYDHSYLCF